jgi:hypothetical protein
LSYKKSITKAMLFSFVLFTFLSSTLTPIIGSIYHDIGLTTSTDFEKIHKGFLYKSESLEAFGGADSYKLVLKGGKPYLFNFNVDNTVGFSIVVTLFGVPGDLLVGAWDADDPKSMRKIVFIYTPDDTSNHTLLIAKILPFDNVETKYTVYVNRNGFAGIWWMLLTGIGALAAIVLAIALIIRSSRKKKKKKKRKRKRK